METGLDKSYLPTFLHISAQFRVTNNLTYSTSFGGSWSAQPVFPQMVLPSGRSLYYALLLLVFCPPAYPPTVTSWKQSSAQLVITNQCFECVCWLVDGVHKKPASCFILRCHTFPALRSCNSGRYGDAACSSCQPGPHRSDGIMFCKDYSYLGKAGHFIAA